MIFELDRFFRGQRRSPVERANHGPPGKDLSQRILALQIILLGVKELAEDEVEGGGINDAAMNAWFMGDAPHRANILGPYHYVGVAWVLAPNGTAYLAVEFG